MYYAYSTEITFLQYFLEFLETIEAILQVIVIGSRTNNCISLQIRNSLLRMNSWDTSHCVKLRGTKHFDRRQSISRIDLLRTPSLFTWSNYTTTWERYSSCYHCIMYHVNIYFEDGYVCCDDVLSVIRLLYTKTKRGKVYFKNIEEKYFLSTTCIVMS